MDDTTKKVSALTTDTSESTYSTDDSIPQQRKLFKALMENAPEGNLVCVVCPPKEADGKPDFSQAKRFIWNGKNGIPKDKHMFFTPNLRHKNFYPANGQGKSEDIIAGLAFFLDIDLKDGRYKSIQKIVDIFHSFPIEPSFILSTGNGCHGYWILQSPVIFNQDFSQQKWNDIQLAFARRLKADSLTIQQPMRMPESFNLKHTDGQFPLCEIIYESDSRPSIETFLDLFPIDAPAEKADYMEVDIPADFKPVEVDKRRFTADLKDLIVEGIDPHEMQYDDHSRSARIDRCVYRMVNRGFSDIEIYSVLTTKAYKITEKIFEENRTIDGCIRYINLSINKARRFFAEETKKLNEQVEDVLMREFQVLGLDGNDLYFSWRGKIKTMKPQDLTERNLKCYTGLRFPKDRIESVVDRIIDTARSKGSIDASNRIGNGIWKLKERFIIISGEDVLSVDSEGIARVSEPVIDGRIVMYEKKWLDLQAFQDGFDSTDAGYLFNEIKDIVSLWNWKDKNISSYVAAFLMLMPFQGAMSWRPFLWFLGAKGTGKSTFIEDVVGGLYSNLVARLDKSTAHASAQSIGNTGKIVIYDEFEKHRHNESILNLWKSGNRGDGGTKTSGTPGADALTYRINHMPVFASVYTPGSDAAVVSRIVRFELMPHLRTGIRLHTEAEKNRLKKMGSFSAGLMCKMWNQIQHKAEAYRENPSSIFGETEGRTADNYAYAQAVINLFSDWGMNQLPDAIHELVEDDGYIILQTILQSIIECKEIRGMYDHTEKRTVSQALCNTDIKADLQSYGLKSIQHRGYKCICIHPEAVQRHLLKDTEYRNLSIREPLKRIAYDIKDVKIAGSTQKTVLVRYLDAGLDESSLYSG